MPLARRVAAESYWTVFFRRLFRVRLAIVCLAVICLVVAAAVLAPVIAPSDPTRAELSRVLKTPSLANPLGTDELGRDVLSRMIYGAQASLYAGLLATAIGLVFGTLLGTLAGYYLGMLETVIMRLVDALLAFPSIVLALAITAALGPSLTNAMIAIGVVNIPGFARLARAQVLSIRHLDYVEAARALGAGDGRIISRHIVPNMMTPIIIHASLRVAFAILTEASLSFLGLGVQPPTPSWGFMLNVGRQYMELAPWLSIFPGLAIFVVVIAINTLGDAIRDALDPRLRLD